jgi:hypothetical protein
MENRYALGRSLQLLGMIVLPLAIAAEVFNQVTLGQSMLIAAAGTLVFFIGYQIQPKP